MTCVHLKQLYQICELHDLKLSSSDLIRITCPECGVQETCPSAHLNEFETNEDDEDGWSAIDSSDETQL